VSVEAKVVQVVEVVTEGEAEVVEVVEFEAIVEAEAVIAAAAVIEAEAVVIVDVRHGWGYGNRHHNRHRCSYRKNHLDTSHTALPPYLQHSLVERY
jgi:hypothetical protein